MGFLWSIFGKNAVRWVVQSFVAIITAANLEKFGLVIEIDQATLSVAIFSGIEALRDYARNKLGWDFL